MVAGNVNYDAILSTTVAHYTPRLEDNIFNESSLLYWLKEAGKIEKVSGGEKIVEPLLYGTNSTAGSYAGYDSLSTLPQEGITAAQYDWKQFAVTIAISGLEEAKNSSKEQVVSLIKGKIEQAEMSAADKLNEHLFGDGTGNNFKNFLGLAAVVSPTGTSSYGTPAQYVGNINTTDNEFWKNQVDATIEALSLAKMSSTYNKCSKGRISPEFILTTQALWEKYEGLLQPNMRYSDPKTASAGFENLIYKSAPIMWDLETPAKTMYFLNSKFLKLKVHSDVWFKNTPFEKPHGQDARYSHILCYGNLTTNNRRFLGVQTEKT